MLCCICGKDEFQNRKGLSYHVSVKHEMKFIDYMLKYELNNIWPTCICGCGTKTKFFSGRFMSYVNGHFHLGRQKSAEHKLKISEFFKGKKLSQSHKDAISLGNINAYANDPTLAQLRSATFLGKTLSDEHRKKLSKTRSAKIASGEIKINKDKISQTVTRMYINGEFKFDHGTYVSTKTNKTCYYRSSWELILMKELDEDIDVLDWESEWMSLEYEFEGSTHRYIPDFHVFRTSSGHSMIEVKPQKLRIIPKNTAKRLVAQEYCLKNVWTYIEWEPKIDVIV